MIGRAMIKTAVSLMRKAPLWGLFVDKRRLSLANGSKTAGNIKATNASVPPRSLGLCAYLRFF